MSKKEAHKYQGFPAEHSPENPDGSAGLPFFPIVHPGAVLHAPGCTHDVKEKVIHQTRPPPAIAL